MQPAAIHHVFPFDLRHFERTPQTWWKVNSTVWPIGAALSGKWSGRTSVHIIGSDFLTHDALRVHAGTYSGPGKSTYGHDFSIPLLQWARRLGPGEVVFLHDAGWPAHSIFAEMGTGARMIGVYHGGSAGTRVRLANMLERHVTLRPEVSDGLHALGVPYARINEVTPSVSEGFFRHHHKSHLKSGAPLTIGFVGRPGTPKGIDTAVRSIRYLREKLGPLRFELVGALAPHDDAAITELAERFTAMDVDFAARGRTANADMPQVMLGWDILAFPSREEGCPRTVLEANALGVPVVGITGVLPKKLVDDKTIRSCDRDRFPQTLLTALLEAPGNSRDSVARTHDFGGAQLDAVVDLLPESKPRVKTSPTAMLGTSAELALGASLPVRVRRKWRWLREHR